MPNQEHVNQYLERGPNMVIVKCIVCGMEYAKEKLMPRYKDCYCCEECEKKDMGGKHEN